ncbi:sensor histidine kinase [Gaoshiqia sediminis]|uniref:histidine kinase n=1 Tax=Gaoshiqia sediminis TaxID=2986998 RepID=A0AA41YAQ4_9BACT|nr:HAMP domain-containing sensor histidine kinase [Gaoshiqia sediminis]MCW0481137.1 HAMP domain-containing histidine kinase [Gaoshiqia sediminis]
MATCLLVSVASLLTSVANYYLNLTGVMYVTLALFLISGIFYGIARYWKLSKELDLAILAIALVFVNLAWFFNFGSRGPMLQVFVSIFAFFLFICDQKKIGLIISLFFLNLLVFFLAEYQDPDITGRYASELVRVSDVYVGSLVAMGFMLIFGLSVKNNYLKQYRQARHSDQLKSAFLANLSHEIRTPLNAIVGFSSLISEPDCYARERKEFQEIIHANSDYLLHLIEDIVDLSKLESGTLTFHPQLVDLQPLFEKLIQNFQRQLDGMSTKVVIGFENDLSGRLVFVDPDRLEQIFRNLLENAVKFTSVGGIHFGCKLVEGHPVFFVSDTGCGIRKENLEAIFDRFVKIDDDPVRLVRGTGVGLFLCRQLVEKMGGNIRVESKYLEGTSFYFSVGNSLPAEIVARFGFQSASKICDLVNQGHDPDKYFSGN